MISKASRLGRPAAPASPVKALVQILATWSMRRRDRRALSMLDDYLLSDIGIDNLTAQREAERPFWRD